MDIYEALALLANRTGLDYVELCAYADEDALGGRRAGYDDWSIDPDEGRLLYALVRALKPARVLEIGVREGASTAHLLAALDSNEAGELYSFDVQANGFRANPRWMFVQADALAADLPAADFVFEDSDHGLQYSLELFEKLRALKPRILVAHDTNMGIEHGEFHVHEAFTSVFPDGFEIVLDGCERGLGIWVNPNDQVIARQPDKSITNKPVSKRATRKPRAKTTKKGV